MYFLVVTIKIIICPPLNVKLQLCSVYRYLKPLDADAAEQKKITKELKELRNNVTAGFAFINLIWVAINFMFQLRKPAIITFPLAVSITQLS